MRKLTIIAGVLALVLAVTVPALAQPWQKPMVDPEDAMGDQYQPEPESVVATGILVKPEAPIYGSHVISDEVAGAYYALRSDAVDLDAYTGQLVTVYGTPVPETVWQPDVNAGPPVGPTLLDVTWVESAGDVPQPGECVEYAPNGFCTTFSYYDGSLQFRTPAS